MRVKALLPFLQKHIPGNPTIVSEFMPGGGGRKAANYIYQSARPDGLTIGNLSSGMVAVAVLGEKGVSYDLNKFFYRGSPFSSHHAIFVTRKDAGLSSIESFGPPLELESAANPWVSPHTSKAAYSRTFLVSTMHDLLPAMEGLSWTQP